MKSRAEHAKEQAKDYKIIRIPTDLHTKLKTKCSIEGRSLGWVMTKIVKEYLDAK